MIITKLIEQLETIKEKYGDLKIECFHHEGGNSLRGASIDLNETHLYIEDEILKIGFSKYE